MDNPFSPTPKKDYSWVWWIVIAIVAWSFFQNSKAAIIESKPTPYPTPKWLDRSAIQTSQADYACTEDSVHGVPWEYSRCNSNRVSPVDPPDNFPDPPGYGDSGSSASCDIKGNISMSSEKIYHVPGQKFYDATVIDESYGERWFCTEDEARASGWRKAEN